MRSSLFTLVLLAAMVVPSATLAADDALTVQTTAGLVRGIDTGDSQEWRGVPFAAPPTGDLRWRPPQPVTPWTGVRDATEFAPVCPQQAWDAETESEFVDGQEDCLYLNILAPRGATGPLPVLVDLHGGSNWGWWPHRSAPAFTSKGVIVVTPAYRLGTFGFVGHPDLTLEGGGSSGEYGLLDQIAALEWVRDNIAVFGGDPDNVTLAGESAGSFDAVALVLSPRATGLFQRAALQTFHIGVLEGWDTMETAEQYGSDMAAAVGCAEADDVLACLRATPAEDLVKAVGFRDVGPTVGGSVLPEPPIDLLAERPILVPLLLGSNREEGHHLVAPLDQTEADYIWVTDNATETLDGLALSGEQVRALYPLADYDSPPWALVAVLTDVDYTCPMRALALGSSGPVWRYLYTHHLQADPLLAELRAAHFLDEPLLFGDPRLLDGYGIDYQFDAADQAVSETMSTYWSNFAKTGDPNGPGVPTWPPYTSDVEPTQVLDDPATTITAWRSEECDVLRS